ncbi:MAG: GlsB/YeaQ/YmgE family stress response membrane protein [Clostridiaceae bacterium]|nr:GlsB/YeaQ/YmgE family stress response membrane protein [Clostridiaceae bacterium]
MNIIGWLIIGALAGWIASLITGNDKRMGAGMNILVGVIGGFVGGFIMNIVGGYGITGFNLWSLLVATGGAVILLLLVNAVRRNKRVI